jgi:ABC-type glycerol-3-phosphate transport system substrate-binding protein
MKKNTIFVLVVALAVITAACGPVATPPPTPVPPTSAPTQPTAAVKPTTAPQPTTAPAKAVEVQFWHAQSQTQEKALNALVEKFNATHPDIKVVATFQGNYSDLFKKNTAAIAAGSPPDLSVAYQNETANYVKSDAVIALDDLMKDPKIGFTDADLKDIFPAFIDRYSQFGGKVYSLAFMRSMEVMFYNVDMLKSAGFDKPPETWDDFMKVCAALSKPPDVVCYEMPGGGAASTFATWVFSRGGDLISADGKTVAFDQKPGLDALNMLNDMFTKKYSIVQAKAYQDQTDFSLGKVVFTFGSTAGLPYYASAIKDANKVTNWGIAPAPHTTKDPVVDVYGPSVTIFKTTPEKQRAAFVFLKWLMDKEPNAEWVKVSSYFSARASTKEALGDFIKANPLYGNAYDWLKYGRGEPTTSAWSPIRTIIGDAMVAVANAKATPDAALKEAAKKANEALAGQ